MKEYLTSRIITDSDLNHHGTLYSGKTVSWIVDNCLIAASEYYGNASDLVCKKIHGITFNSPVSKGQSISITSKVVYVGNTSITVYGKVSIVNNRDIISDGFITFVTVDSDGRKKNHGLISPESIDREEEQLILKAKSLK